MLRKKEIEKMLEDKLEVYNVIKQSYEKYNDKVNYELMLHYEGQVLALYVVLHGEDYGKGFNIKSIHRTR